MAEAQQGTQGTEQGANGAAAGGVQAGAEPPKPKPAEAGAGGAAAAGGQQEPKKVRLADNDEIPEGSELLELSPSAFKKRLSRHSAAELKRHFGTDDPAQIKKDLEELATLRSQKEKDRVAKLSEEQKLKEEIQRSNARAEAAEATAKQLAEDREFERSDSRMAKIAEKHIDPEFVDAETTRFARHLRKTYSESELEKMRARDFDKEADSFFAARVKDRPKLARDYEEKRSAELKRELKDEMNGKKPKVPVSNGADKDGAAQGKSGGGGDGGGGNGKSMRPGQQNSMTSAEARAEAAKSGHRWW